MAAPARFPAALRLSDKERLFAINKSKGMKTVAAATVSGYAPEYAETIGNQLIAQGNVQAAIAIELGRMLQTESAPLALKVGMELLGSETTAERGREGPAKQEAPGDKALHEMSGEDLRRSIARLEGELAERAKPVIGTTIEQAPAQI